MTTSLKPLKILSASAGSGKTFALVQEYLKINMNETNGQFESLLAMTFTNKAALEMKERIISALDLLAYPTRNSPKEQKKADDLMIETQKRTGKSTAEINNFALRILGKILHNYGDFKVQTIDKFSLQLIRTFSRDLNINEDFDVILKEKELLERVVDQLLSNLSKPGYEKVTRYALHYAKTNLDEGQSWNFRKSLIEFSQTLIKEANKEYIQQIISNEYDEETLKSYRNELNQIKNKLKQIQETLGKIMDEHQIQASDLPYGKNGIYSYIQKSITNIGEYSSPTQRTNDVLEGISIKAHHIFPDELKNKLIEYIEFGEQNKERLYFLDKLIKNYFNLALLKYIAQELEDLKEQDNVIMISDFNKMIALLLQEEETDYVYERLGNRYNHYLLDEFQDTSRLQWLNLVPLVHNSISQNYSNLIVGDPKQAIYRFRNGVVEQFVELPKIYNPENDPKIGMISNHFEALGKTDTIKENWRSAKNIVLFNNQVFNSTKSELGEFSEYYKSVEQTPKKSVDGYVRMEFVEDLKKEHEEDFLLKTIRACEADKFNRGDICILARNKKDGGRWARILSKAPEKYKVVSEDSLSVQSDKTVQLFILYCLIRKNTGNPTPQIRFADLYFSIQGMNSIEALKGFWTDKKIGKINFTAFVEELFESSEKFWFNYENLYDLGQKFLRLIDKTELSNPYLHHLMEMLHDYDTQYGPDLRGFLEYWSEEGKNQAVQIPENKDAIRIMTAHKSKGLEFPIVILPRLSWELKVKDSFFINTPEDDLLYTRVSKNADSELVQQRQALEFSKVLLDEYNLLYVAFTRAEKRLYGLIDSKQGNSLMRLDQIIYSHLSEIHQALNESSLNELYFELGETTENEQKDKEDDDTITHFKAKDVTDTLWFPEITLNNEPENEFLSEEMAFGRQLHLILEKVNHLEELDDVMTELIAEDLLDKSQTQRLHSKAKEVLETERMQALLSNANKIISEQTILVDEKNQIRPDKLFIQGESCTVLDYKTGIKTNKHLKQLDGYMNCLRDIGFKSVNGLLLYTDQMEWIEQG